MALDLDEFDRLANTAHEADERMGRILPEADDIAAREAVEDFRIFVLDHLPEIIAGLRERDQLKTDLEECVSNYNLCDSTFRGLGELSIKIREERDRLRKENLELREELRRIQERSTAAQVRG